MAERERRGVLAGGVRGTEGGGGEEGRDVLGGPPCEMNHTGATYVLAAADAAEVVILAANMPRVARRDVRASSGRILGSVYKAGALEGAWMFRVAKI